MHLSNSYTYSYRPMKDGDIDLLRFLGSCPDEPALGLVFVAHTLLGWSLASFLAEYALIPLGKLESITSRALSKATGLSRFVISQCLEGLRRNLLRPTCTLLHEDHPCRLDKSLDDFLVKDTLLAEHVRGWDLPDLEQALEQFRSHMQERQTGGPSAQDFENEIDPLLSGLRYRIRDFVSSHPYAHDEILQEALLAAWFTFDSKDKLTRARLGRLARQAAQRWLKKHTYQSAKTVSLQELGLRDEEGSRQSRDEPIADEESVPSPDELVERRDLLIQLRVPGRLLDPKLKLWKVLCYLANRLARLDQGTLHREWADRTLLQLAREVMEAYLEGTLVPADVFLDFFEELLDRLKRQPKPPAPDESMTQLGGGSRRSIGTTQLKDYFKKKKPKDQPDEIGHWIGSIQKHVEGRMIQGLLKAP